MDTGPVYIQKKSRTVILQLGKKLWRHLFNLSCIYISNVELLFLHWQSLDFTNTTIQFYLPAGLCAWNATVNSIASVLALPHVEATAYW